MPAQPQRGGREAPHPKKKKPLLLRVAIVLYACVVCVSALIVGAYAAFTLFIKPPEIPADSSQPASSQPNTPAVKPGRPDASQAGEPEPIGRQRREGVYNVVLLGRDKESGNTDTIILVSYDTVQQKVGMTSIPRDTVVKRDWSKNLKINYAYPAKGPETLKQEIKQTFGIPVDYYVYINLKGFVALVDQLGGVEVNIPEDMNYDDPYQDLHIHYTAGHHYLNGQQAMEVARFRDNNDGTGYTDLGRGAMQRQILVNLAKKVLSWQSLSKVQSFIDIFRKYVETDISASDMVWFASKAMGFDISTGLTQQNLEGRGDGIYKGYQWCYVYQAEDILPTLELLNPYDQPLTADDLDLIVPDRYYFKS